MLDSGNPEDILLYETNNIKLVEFTNDLPNSCELEHLS